MPKRPPTAAPKWLPPTAAALAALFLIGLFSTEMADPDSWWHLKTGQYILERHRLPFPDPFAWTTAGAAPGYPGEEVTRRFNLTHEWLAQVLMYLVWAAGGFGAVVFAKALLLAGMCGLAGFVAARRTGSYGKLSAAEKELQKAQQELAEQQKDHPILKEEVGEEEIARIVSKWTGIPVGRLLEGEIEKLVHMEERLRQRVVGQEDALERVANAVRRSRSGLADPNRPIGSFIFMGPTGVGKTELARALAEFLFDDDHAMVRLDMSEYMEKHSVARLIGAPPGYVGYEEGGQLTEQIRRRPYAVILFDEIEKAHPDIFNVLLQILEDGRLTDGKGRTVDFRNSVIVMTSNVGSAAIFELSASDPKKAREQAFEALRHLFRPEFLNRVDDIVLFQPLGKEQLEPIIDLQLARLVKQLEQRGITIKLTKAARGLLFKEGYDPAYGARPLRRAIQRLIQDPLAMQLLNGSVLPGDHVLIDADAKSGEMKFEREAVTASA